MAACATQVMSVTQSALHRELERVKLVVTKDGSGSPKKPRSEGLETQMMSGYGLYYQHMRSTLHEGVDIGGKQHVS